MSVYKIPMVLEAKDITPELQEVCAENRIFFSVNIEDVVSMELGNPCEFSERTVIEICRAGWPVFYANEDGTITLESCWGFGQEDRIVCTRIVRNQNAF